MAPPTAVAWQQKILDAIQALSDQLAVRKIISPTDLDARLVVQDRLGAAEDNARNAPILIRLDAIERGIALLTAQVTLTNGTLRQHDTKIAVMDTFCTEQVKPALVKIENMRLDIKGLMVQAGGTAAIVAVLIGIAKAAGWL